MTEEEAKTKWCPLAENGSRGGNIHDRMNGETPAGLRCIGSSCMAWRELPATVRNITEKHVEQTSRDGEVPAVRHRIYDRKIGEDVTPNGFCGLAGKP